MSNKRDNHSISLQKKLVNTLMNSGNKRTGEKILMKSLKLLQKLTAKKHINLIQLAVINATPTFKVNQQLLKKGKRKSKKDIPTFITNDSLRTMLSLKFIKAASSKSQSSAYFYENLTQEILASSTLKSQSVEKKNELQKRTLINKRYLSKFRW
jgi:ribosomal protein S7